MTDHGPIKTASYLINKIFYGSDVSNIDKKIFKKLKLNYFCQSIVCVRSIFPILI